MGLCKKYLQSLLSSHISSFLSSSSVWQNHRVLGCSVSLIHLNINSNASVPLPPGVRVVSAVLLQPMHRHRISSSCYQQLLNYKSFSKKLISNYILFL
jgi:hypothetical protein